MTKKAVSYAEKKNLGYNKRRNWKHKRERECIACKEGYFLVSGKRKVRGFSGTKYCRKCSAKNCKVCAKKGCNVCENGYKLNLGRCVSCKKKEVFDMWARRCFKRKKNRYMDIHYNYKEQFIMISD